MVIAGPVGKSPAIAGRTGAIGGAAFKPVRGLVWKLLIVKVAVDVDPMACVPKDNVAEGSVLKTTELDGTTAVPSNEIGTGVEPAPDETASVVVSVLLPADAPAAAGAGVKVNDNVQVAPGARFDGHEFDCTLKSLLFVPENCGVPIVTAEVPLLVRVTV